MLAGAEANRSAEIQRRKKGAEIKKRNGGVFLRAVTLAVVEVLEVVAGPLQGAAARRVVAAVVPVLVEVRDPLVQVLHRRLAEVVARVPSLTRVNLPATGQNLGQNPQSDADVAQLHDRPKSMLAG